MEEYIGRKIEMEVAGKDINWKEVMKPYPRRKIVLPNGDEMIVRNITVNEVEKVAEAFHPKCLVHRDLFDMITHELCTELYLWKIKRPMWGCMPESHFCLVGEIEDEIVGASNGVLSSPEVGNSLHTIAIREGMQIGAQIWGCKLEHYFDVLGVKEVHAAAESPRGGAELFRTFGFEEHPDKVVHFGTSPMQRMTKKQWERIRPGKITGKRI